jgi:hypothetical protein
VRFEIVRPPRDCVERLRVAIKQAFPEGKLVWKPSCDISEHVYCNNKVREVVHQHLAHSTAVAVINVRPLNIQLCVYPINHDRHQMFDRVVANGYEEERSARYEHRVVHQVV